MNKLNRDYVYEMWNRRRKKSLLNIGIYFAAIILISFIFGRYLAFILTNIILCLKPDSEFSFNFRVFYVIGAILLLFHAFKYIILGYKKGCNIEAPYYGYSMDRLVDRINKDIAKAELSQEEHDSKTESDCKNNAAYLDEQQKRPYTKIKEDLYLLSDYIVLGTNKGKVIVIPIRKLCFYGVKQVKRFLRDSKTFILFITENTIIKYEINSKEKAVESVAKLDIYLHRISNRREKLPNIMCCDKENESMLLDKLEQKYKYDRDEFFELVRYR